MTDDILSYQSPNFKTPLFIDFIALENRLKKKEPELILKAIGLEKNKRSLTILDTTCGLGSDAFVIFSKYKNLTALERNKTMFDLLTNAIYRYETLTDHKLFPLLHQDSINFLENSEPFDVIYIDTMFKKRDGRLNKRELRIVREIVGEDLDDAELFAKAYVKARQKLIVKKPKNALAYYPVQPSYTLFGTSTRFDVFLPN